MTKEEQALIKYPPIKTSAGDLNFEKRSFYLDGLKDATSQQGYSEKQIREALIIKGLFLHDRQVNEVIEYLSTLTPAGSSEQSAVGEKTIAELNLKIFGLKTLIKERDDTIDKLDKQCEKLQNDLKVPTMPFDTPSDLINRISGMDFRNIDRTRPEGILLSKVIAILCFIHKPWQSKVPELVFRVVKDIYFNPFIVESPDETMERIEETFIKENN